MYKKITLCLLPLLLGLILFLAGCTPPTSGIFWDLEREKVIDVRHNGVPNDVNTSNFQKYTNGNSFFLMICGTTLYISTSPVSTWHGVNIINGLDVADLAVVGNTVYAILVGTSGANAGLAPALYSTSFSDIYTGQFPTWTQVSTTTSSLPITTIIPMKLAVTGTTPTLIVQSDASAVATNSSICYLLYKYSGGIFSQLSGPSGLNIITAYSPGLILTQGTVYSVDNPVTTYTPTLVATASPGNSFTAVVDNGINVFVARSNGQIWMGTSPGTGWSLNPPVLSLGTTCAFSSLAWVNMQDFNSAGNFQGLLAGTTGQGLFVIDYTTYPGQPIIKYPTNNVYADVITNGNFSSTKITNITGIYSDATGVSSPAYTPIYLTTLKKGLWSSVYFTSTAVSGNGLIFTWQ